MDLIYTDSNMVDGGVLKTYELDYEIGGDNSFSISTDISSPLSNVGLFYFENEEYGGLIDSVKIDVKSGKKTSSGRTWRGLLSSYIIEPPAGQAYKEITGTLLSIISALISNADLEDLFETGTSEISGMFTVQFDRYTDVYSGIAKLMKENNGKLSFRWNAASKKTVISIKNAVTYVGNSDLIALTLQKSSRRPNAVIGLGSGELTDRMVITRYINSAGEVVESNPYVSGTDIWTIVHDYPNAESEEELVKSSVNALVEARSKLDFISISVNDVYLDLFDSVTAEAVGSGLSVTATVTRKIVKVKEGKISMSYEVE